MNTNRYLAFLKQVVSPPRLEHSLGVRQVMGELASVYGLDREQAETAGLLHDAAKELPPAQRESLIAAGQIVIRHISERDYDHYLHGPVGAYFVRTELGLTDPAVLDAIAMHTYYGAGDGFDAPLCWGLRFADLLEPNRRWHAVRQLRHGLPRLRVAAYGGRLGEAAFLETGWLLSWYAETDRPIHPNMTRTYNTLAEQLGVDGTYLDIPPAE